MFLLDNSDKYRPFLHLKKTFYYRENINHTSKYNLTYFCFSLFPFFLPFLSLPKQFSPKSIRWGKARHVPMVVGSGVGSHDGPVWGTRVWEERKGCPQRGSRWSVSEPQWKTEALACRCGLVCVVKVLAYAGWGARIARFSPPHQESQQTKQNTRHPGTFEFHVNNDF